MFSKGVPTEAAHILAVGKGKSRGDSRSLGHVFFFLQRTRGQHNRAIHFKGAPWGSEGERGGEAEQENTKVEAFMLKPQLSITCFDTMETGAVTETNWTTETPTGSQNK